MAARSDSDWRHALVRSYADLFRPTGEPPYAAAWPNVGDGWQRLLERACRRIRASLGEEGRPFKLISIAEKYGSLRVQWEGRLSPAAAQRVEEAVDLAEARSMTTCEICGRRGALHAGGWLVVRCDDHAEGRPAVAFEQGFENLHVERRLVGGRIVASYRFYDRDADRFVGVRNTVPAFRPGRGKDT
ncbi:hypothetical protein [Bradyrhizobium yuanmingense]|uniref:hypothetical protein n=1 Tax=Bradyrhizobium yuanmingense TaxID=108015 RepID=UPI001CD61D67|nr:hypothetical protein [Bradyrhizobium yuanmingense]MCA1529456.1 hypothetical protein [Bradyrhizobium yuanmingense]